MAWLRVSKATYDKATKVIRRKTRLKSGKYRYYIRR